ncbi:MAG: AMP-binding protein [Bacteroidaceae bacterium]
MIKENFIKLYESSFRDNWELPCYTDWGTPVSYSYGEVAIEIAKLHLLFKKLGFKRGTKIALLGKNNARWCIAYMATITYGAVIVPILQDFPPADIHHIITHSESKLLFASESLWDQLDANDMPDLRGALAFEEYRPLFERGNKLMTDFQNNVDGILQKEYAEGYKKTDINYTNLDNDKVMLLNYTSGTTGFSKGVMLTGNNLAGNVTFGIRTELLVRGDRILSFLPLAHAFGCAFDFLTATAVGAHVTLLGKTPSPNILLKAFSDVKPSLILSVPLVIEKIYKNVIVPLLKKRTMRWALSVPMLDSQIYAQIRKKLVDAMGGEFKEIIIGGAALNPEVEQFFYRIKFPFTIGYGMTECGPLISYSSWDEFKASSSGKILDIMQVRIVSDDPYTKLGEIQVYGENVMSGYYKNKEATKEVFTEDGWFKTGDLGTIDVYGNIYIRGRSKTMILTASGQNIFPEEIESRLNNMPFVHESLIVERKSKLVALVHPDIDLLKSLEQCSANRVQELMDENLKELNRQVANYERISRIELMKDEFAKTPKKSIKRFQYEEGYVPNDEERK